MSKPKPFASMECAWVVFDPTMRECGKPAVAMTVGTHVKYCAEHAEKARCFGPMTVVKEDLFER